MRSSPSAGVDLVGGMIPSGKPAGASIARRRRRGRGSPVWLKSPFRMAAVGTHDFTKPVSIRCLKYSKPMKKNTLSRFLLKLGARDEQGPAEVEAGVEELVLDPLAPDLVREPVVRVQVVVAEVRVERPMEVVAARLADHGHGHGALGVLGAEVGLEDLELLGHLRVRVHRGAAVAARVHCRGAIDRDVEGGGAGAVARVKLPMALWLLFPRPDTSPLPLMPTTSPVKTGPVLGSHRHRGEPGEDLEQLRGAASHDRACSRSGRR